MLKSTKVIVLLLLAGFITVLQAPDAYGQGEGSKKRKNALKLAKDHMKYEEYEQAMPQIEQLLAQDPNNAYYNFWMGKCLYVLYKRNKALPYLDAAAKVDPEVDPEFHYYYGLTLHYNLKFDQAIAEFTKDLARYEMGSADYDWVSNRITQCNYAKKLITKKEGQKVKINNAGTNINSEFSEHSPVISANDSLLIYTARRPQSLGAKTEAHFYDEDLYIAQKAGKEGGNEWTEGKNIGTPVNSKGHDATISLNATGDVLYIYRHKKDGGLYRADFDKEGKKWKEPVKVERPLNSKYYEASICVSADSNLMFFTSSRPGGFGGLDIYMVERLNGNWGEPLNMGPMINTAYNEDAPYFHPDNKTLYYSSDGPRSMGGYDIYVTEFDSVKNSWLEPLNMGYPVNTPDDDIYFVLSASGKFGYYSSGKEGGYGEKDIYQIEFPYYPYPRRYFIVELTGGVTDAQTRLDIPSKIRLVDAKTNKILDSMDTDGGHKSFYFILEGEKTYNLEVSSPNYLPALVTLTAPKPVEEDLLIEQPVSLVAEKKPDIVIPVKAREFPEIQNIYFDFDKHHLRKASQDELYQVADFMLKNPDVSVKLKAHADWYNTYQYNVDLSDKRAKSAYDYLIRAGVPASRLSKEHFSENTPLTTNENDEGRQFNRRVEFEFTTADGSFKSVKLHQGVTSIEVDHTAPKGQPGFDYGTPSLPTADSGSPSQPASSGQESGGQLVGSQTTGGRLTGTSGGTRLSGTTGGTRLGDKSTTTDAGTPPATDVKNDLTSALAGLALHHIYFDFDKFDLRSASVAELDRIAQFLATYPDLSIEIWGHTDSYGSNGYNKVLSDNRCNSAVDYLKSKGIASGRIKQLGYSEEKPMDTNNTTAGRQNNRRVEFRLLQGGMPVYISIP